jgi:hypothetical protein
MSDTEALLAILTGRPEAIVKVLAWLDWSLSRLIDAMDNEPRIALSYDARACGCQRRVIGNKKYTHIRRRDAE